MPWSLCTHTWNTPLCSERMRLEDKTNQTDDRVHFSKINHIFPLNKIQTFNSTIEPRISSADEYYHIYMLGINHSKGLTDLGSIKFNLLLCLISIFIVMYMELFRINVIHY